MRAGPILIALCLAACSADRAGWARRGGFWKLLETPSLQVRRGPQGLDPRTGEIVLPWCGARAPDGEPAILACELAVFDDRNGDGRPDPGEVLRTRESAFPTTKVLFDDVRARPTPGSRLRVRLKVRTDEEETVVGWALAVD